MLRFDIQFLSVFIELHLFRQRVGNIKLNFFTGFFKRRDEIPRLTGNTCNHCLRFDGNIE